MHDFFAGSEIKAVLFSGRSFFMSLKKCLLTGLASVLVLSAVTVPASAHGHRRAVAVQQRTVYPTCAVADCTLSGIHTHDGISCCRHSQQSGICDYCGNDCGAQLCAVEGCALSGVHTHNGASYCHHNQENGSCTHCGTYFGVPSTSAAPYYGGHHGGHCRTWY